MPSLNTKKERSVSYYEILNIEPLASDEDVKKAYRKMAMRFHPDQNPQNRRMSELHFKLINEAYSHLKTKKQRSNYNHLMHIDAHNDNTFQQNTSWISTLAALFWPTNNKS
ncbi:MAG: J domain-containing protein [Alphaproteobacteria bacterium]|nr:J domain-containing protein [Alphaproteobacteria bacterium]